MGMPEFQDPLFPEQAMGQICPLPPHPPTPPGCSLPTPGLEQHVPES